MKESHIEGIANHGDPESCAVAREDDGEALTGARTGRTLSREILQIQDADAVMPGGRQHAAVRNREYSCGPARSKTPGTYGISARENREIPQPSGIQRTPERGRKAKRQTLLMHGRGKSDSLVLPAKPPNNAPMAAEVVEGRRLTKVNTVEQNASRTQRRQNAPSALDRVRQIATRDKGMQFTSLMHHVTIDLLRKSFSGLNRKAAPGIDGITWTAYSQNLEENLLALHDRVQSGRYRAKASRRTYIQKSDGSQRPLGIAALEDKIVQAAVVVVLNAVYEADFKGFSYGFRPGRHQHQALDALATGLVRKRINWVLDADVRGFFDTLSHDHLRKFVRHRIKDGRMLRLINKWLRAGVLKDGARIITQEGVPQGATVSPLLANLYLHYVLDVWLTWWRKNEARGEVILVRYADDFVAGFQYKSDADRFHAELRGRFAKFSLALHPDKTRLINFGSYAQVRRQERGLRGNPDTFSFLGFTHICGLTRNKRFLLVRKTMRKRMTSKLHELKAEMMKRRHQPVPQQGRWLVAVLRGHCAYYGVPTNARALQAFRDEMAKNWQQALCRRSQRNRLTWSRMQKLARRWVPYTRIMHPWPWDRFDASNRGRSPVR